MGGSTCVSYRPRATPPTRCASISRPIGCPDGVTPSSARGTTVVAHPDGRLGDYLNSLRRLRSLTVDDGVHTVLPGHGPVLEDAQGAVEFYLAHRAHRLAQVETAVENGYRSPAEVVAHVYADVDRSLWPAAELSVRAQMDYLREHGLVGAGRPGGGWAPVPSGQSGPYENRPYGGPAVREPALRET